MAVMCLILHVKVQLVCTVQLLITVYLDS